MLQSQTLSRTLPLATSAGPPLATLLVNYGIALEDRFKLHGDPADLDAAIDANEKAVASTPPATIQWPPNLNSLALSLHERFVLTANLADLPRSVDLLHQAVERQRAEVARSAGPAAQPGCPARRPRGGHP